MIVVDYFLDSFDVEKAKHDRWISSDLTELYAKKAERRSALSPLLLV
jgi:hypothetical protein